LKQLAVGAFNKVIATYDRCPDHQERLKKCSEKTSPGTKMTGQKNTGIMERWILQYIDIVHKGTTSWSQGNG